MELSASYHQGPLSGYPVTQLSSDPQFILVTCFFTLLLILTQTLLPVSCPGAIQRTHPSGPNPQHALPIPSGMDGFLAWCCFGIPFLPLPTQQGSE